MKNCEVCGTFNFKENNYCTHCGCKIVEENICPFCGEKNPDSSAFCINCHKQITPVPIDTFDDLFSEYNLELLSNPQFGEEDYFDILETVFKKLDYINITGKTPKDKVLQIANVFTSIIPKSSGIMYGEYGSSVIYYDDRLEESLQISTIIHELAHYLFFDLNLNMLCEILHVKPSPVIKSFIEYFLVHSRYSVMNEFYAHTVENRFIPINYQRFDSFYEAIESYELDNDTIEVLIVLGYSFAQDIIPYLDKYIDESIRESILLQFKIDMVELKNRRYEEFDNQKLGFCDRYFIYVMGDYFNYFYNNEEARKELENIRYGFED